MAGKSERKARRLALLAENKRLRRREARLAGRLDRLSGLSRQMGSLSEMGEMESLRLQMAVDRMSKTMAALGNMLGKMARAQAAIARAMK